ncbi:MAG TPA: hypothetical protein VLC10_05535 [Patescibacteria group bacterium]|nr:hypothetical protein [Patescibacteria group bacterium]
MERPQKTPVSTIVIVLVVAGLFAGATALVSMIPEPTDDAGACRVTEALGFTEPRILHRYPGHVAAWQRGCGEDDTSAVDMRAVDAAGRARQFLVCCGGYGNNVGCSIRNR